VVCRRLCAIAALNLVACLALLVLRWRITWWLVVGLQAAVLLASVVEGMAIDPLGWISRLVPEWLNPSDGRLRRAG
jgi:hypothetical protein